MSVPGMVSVVVAQRQYVNFRRLRFQVIPAAVWTDRTSGNTGGTTGSRSFAISGRWFRAQQCEQAPYVHLLDLNRRGAGDTPQGTWPAEWTPRQTSTERSRTRRAREVARRTERAEENRETQFDRRVSRAW